jgi:hypothetical protein
LPIADLKTTDSGSPAELPIADCRFEDDGFGMPIGNRQSSIGNVSCPSIANQQSAIVNS